MARGKIYPHSLVVADKYSAGYCQVIFIMCIMYNVLAITWICWLLSGAFIFMARSRLMNLN